MRIKPTNRMKKNGDLSVFERGMVVRARQTRNYTGIFLYNLRISERMVRKKRKRLMSISSLGEKNIKVSYAEERLRIA